MTVQNRVLVNKGTSYQKINLPPSQVIKESAAKHRQGAENKQELGKKVGMRVNFQSLHYLISSK